MVWSCRVGIYAVGPNVASTGPLESQKLPVQLSTQGIASSKVICGYTVIL